MVCPHGAGADVAHFARADEVVEGLHGFGGGGGGVEAVDLQEVDVVGSEAAEGGVYGCNYGAAGEA